MEVMTPAEPGRKQASGSRAIWLPIAVALAFTLCACATKYQPVGFEGGYSEWQVDANTFQVSFNGNGYTERETVEMYLLFRCAELTASNGFDYFLILDSGTAGTTSTHWISPGTYSSRTTATATSFGNTAVGTANTTGTYTPPTAIQFQRYGATAVIRAFNGERPHSLPNAFVAADVLTYMSPKIRR